MKLALKVNDEDNVATVFACEVQEGDRVEVRDPKGSCEQLCVRGDVPYGHKIALCAIAQGEPVRKYGEVIGAATRPIAAGEYVHVHNLESLRGRGDRERGKSV